MKVHVTYVAGTKIGGGIFWPFISFGQKHGTGQIGTTLKLLAEELIGVRN